MGFWANISLEYGLQNCEYSYWSYRLHPLHLHHYRYQWFDCRVRVRTGIQQLKWPWLPWQLSCRASVASFLAMDFNWQVSVVSMHLNDFWSTKPRFSLQQPSFWSSKSCLSPSLGQDLDASRLQHPLCTGAYDPSQGGPNTKEMRVQSLSHSCWPSERQSNRKSLGTFPSSF